jgi:hypothetical protein
MKFFVAFFTSALVLYIIPYGVFIPMSAYGGDEIPFRPEFSSPQLLLHARYSLEYLPGCYALDCPHDPRRTVPRHRLEQEMNMVFLNPNLNENNLVPLRNLQTYILENQIYLFRKHNPPVLGRTHQMIQQYRHVTLLMDIFTHTIMLTSLKKPKQASGN